MDGGLVSGYDARPRSERKRIKMDAAAKIRKRYGRPFRKAGNIGLLTRTNKQGHCR